MAESETALGAPQEERIPSRRTQGGLWQQCSTIIYHTWLLKIANKTSTFTELLLPIIAVGFALIYPYFIPKGDTPLTQKFAKLGTPNYSHIYTFDSVPVKSSGNSYLARGHFVPMSRLLVSPNSPTTTALAKKVFICVLELAGYNAPLAPSDIWTTSDPLLNSLVYRYPQPDGTVLTNVVPITTSYVVDDLTIPFDNAADAIKAVTARDSKLGDNYLENQAPVALIFEDAAITSPSYSLHFGYAAIYNGPDQYASWNRLPDASPQVKGCLPLPVGPLPGQQVEQNCYTSYSDCVGSDLDSGCEVRYNQEYFAVPSPLPCSTDKYIFSGAVALQLCVDTEITRLHADNVGIHTPQVSTQMMPRQIQRVEPPNTGLNVTLFFLMIGCGGFTTICVVWLVAIEKERKLKQLLHMIGVSTTAYWLGWFLGYVLIWAVIGTLLWAMLFFSDSSELKSTDGWMLLIIIWMAGINAIVMAFLFVSLFNKAVIAVMFAVVYIFAIGILYIVLAALGSQGTTCYNGTYWGLSLLGNYALLIAFDRMIFLTLYKGSTEWSDFSTHTSSGGMSIGEAFMMQILDTILYALLAYYFDHVMPNKHGKSYHALFCIKPTFWRDLWASGSREEKDEIDSVTVTTEVLTELNANPDVESVEITTSVADHAGIATQKLCKDFNSGLVTLSTATNKLAVDHLSLAIYKSEITAILGHNGAGKTTTIRMLTGQTSPSSGTAFVLGHNIHSYAGLRAVQATLGLATQDNILWPTFTIAQHMEIFGRLKGMTGTEVKNDIAKLLTQLDLLDKIDFRSAQLSGGQKRRLCMALALVGDPQIVFLDEPSCGVDPQSRRKMWDTLLSYKAKDRCIVLTTHSMYEADVLADRKLVIMKGKLRCAGTSVFLKNRFGVGYNLNVEFDLARTDINERQKSINDLTQQIATIMPDAVFPHTYGSNFEQLQVQLPKNEMAKTTELFQLLEGEPAEKMKINDVGVSMVSLEEVFLRLSKENDPLEAEERTSNSAADFGRDFVDSSPSFWKTFVALLRVRFLLWRRRPARCLAALAISIGVVFLAAYFEVLIDGEFNRDGANEAAHALSISNTPVDLRQYQTLIFTSQNTPLIISAPNNNDFEVATQALSKTSIISTRLPTDKTYNDLDWYGGAQEQSNAYYAGARITAWPQNSAQTAPPAEYTVWYNGTFIHSLPLALNVINSMFYNTMTGSLQSGGITTKIYQQSEAAQVNSKSQSTSNQIYVTLAVPLFYTIAISFFTAVLVVDSVYDYQTGAIRLLRLSNASGLLYWMPMFVVHIVTYWLPILLAFVIFCNIWKTSFVALTSLSVFTFILHTFLFVLVMTLLAYCASWLFVKVSTAMATYLIVSVVLALVAGVVADMLGIMMLNDSVKNQAVLDTNYAKATQALSIIIPWWGYAGGLVGLSLDSNFRALSVNSTIWQQKTWNGLYVAGFIGLVLWLLIALCLLVVIESIKNGNMQTTITRFFCRNATDAQMRKQLELDEQSDLFGIDTDTKEDDDVRAERYLTNKCAVVLAEQATFTDKEARPPTEPPPAVTVLHLQKRYGQVFQDTMENCRSSPDILVNRYRDSRGAAVRNISFRVLPNEIFGLLGPNGAGKTTTMSMLVNDTRPTAGLIYINNYNSVLQQAQASHLLGYCPQFDALWDEVTVAEHLHLMASLHGQEANMQPPHGLIIRMAKKLGLVGEHWNKNAHNLSGGTRRKLSFLISIIDRNMTSLLDEPSSGMDPGSSRFLWDIIKHHFKNRPLTRDDISAGCILTTHYMEEAEALCDRIAIMTKGNIRCIGTPTHLRNKFGAGYRLELRLVDGREETCAAATKDIMGQFSDAILKKNESGLNRLVFSVPQHQALPLSKSFAFLEALRASPSDEAALGGGTSKLVVEYTISQASIEHVFLQIAGEKENEEA